MATAYMNLELPAVDVTDGPLWATQIVDAFERIDAHTHEDGDGAKVTPNGLDINTDLDVGGNDLTDVRALRLESQSSELVGASDLRCVYSTGGDLWFNSATGTAIQITSGGGLNLGATASNIWEQQTVSGNITIAASDSFVMLKVNTTAARTINLPGASSVTAGRYYLIKDISGQSETNVITVVRSGANTIEGVAGNLELSLNYGAWFIVSDGVSAWHVHRGAPATLTKSSLTLGSTVLNTSGLTTGAVTASTVTAGASSVSTSAIVSGGTISGTTIAASDALVAGSNVLIPNGGALNARNSADTSYLNLISLGVSDGVTIGGASTSVVAINGPVTIDDGLTVSSGTSAIALDASSTVTYSSPRTISQIIPGHRSETVNAYGAGNWTIQFSGTTRVGRTTGTTGANLIIEVPNPIHGSTLSTVDFAYELAGGARTPLTNRLQMRLYRQDIAYAGAAEELFSTGAQSVPAYSVFGDVLTTTFTTNQNNVIDAGNYIYWIVVKEESGTGAVAGNFVLSFKLNYTVSDVLAAI